jgi:predicted nucleotidyltransferase
VRTSLNITQTQRCAILSLLEQYIPTVRVWAYGSRVKGTSQPHSDLDMIVFATQEEQSQISSLKEAFEESNLPFRVDLFVWDEVPEEFHKNIEKEHVILQ